MGQTVTRRLRSTNDFGDRRIHDVRLEATLPVDPRKTYPVCVASQRAAPPEDYGGPSAFIAHRHYYAGVGRGRSPEDLGDFADEFDDEELDGFSDYDPDRFDRRHINRRLANWLPVPMRRRLMKLTIQVLIESSDALPLSVPIQTIELV